MISIAIICVAQVAYLSIVLAGKLLRRGVGLRENQCPEYPNVSGEEWGEEGSAPTIRRFIADIGDCFHNFNYRFCIFEHFILPYLRF